MVVGEIQKENGFSRMLIIKMLIIMKGKLVQEEQLIESLGSVELSDVKKVK